MSDELEQVRQGRSLTFSQYNFSTYEQRILMYIVHSSQDMFREVYNNKDAFYYIAHANKVIEMRLADIARGSHDYSAVQGALSQLVEKTLTYYSNDKKSWYKANIINDVVCKNGVAKFKVSNTFYYAFLDISKGFHWYYFETAMSFKSSYTARLYMLICSLHRPISIRIDTIKQWLQLTDRYSLTADFVKKIIEPARCAYDEAKTNSFTYEKVYDGRKIDALLIKPVHRQNIHEMPKDNNEFWSEMNVLEVKQYLMKYCKFSMKELRPHHDLCVKLADNPMAFEIIQNIRHRSLKQFMDINKGYIIQGLRGEVSDEGYHQQQKRKQMQKYKDM